MNQTNEQTLPTLPLNEPKLMLTIEKNTSETAYKEESKSTTDEGCSAVPRAESEGDLQVKAKSRKCANDESEEIPVHKNCTKDKKAEELQREAISKGGANGESLEIFKFSYNSLNE